MSLKVTQGFWSRFLRTDPIRSTLSDKRGCVTPSKTSLVMRRFQLPDGAKAASCGKRAIVSKGFRTSMCFQQQLHPKVFQESTKLQCKHSFLSKAVWGCYEFTEKQIQRVADLQERGKHFSKQCWKQPPVDSFVTVSPWNKLWRFAELSHVPLSGWWFAEIHRGSRIWTPIFSHYSFVGGWKAIVPLWFQVCCLAFCLLLCIFLCRPTERDKLRN